jgi:hypothetical protein
MVAALIALSGFAVIGADRLAACGDKFLNVGLGTHYHRSQSERKRSAVLMYVSPGTELSRMMTALTVEAGMKKAGYQPTIVSTSASLETALRAQAWDVVIVDGRDAASIVPRLPKTNAPQVVPVLSKPTKDELKGARKAFETVIDSPSKNAVFVDVVDYAVDLHEMEAEDAAKAAKKATR